MDFFGYMDETEDQSPVDFFGLKMTPRCAGERSLGLMPMFPYAGDTKDDHAHEDDHSEKEHFPFYW